MLLLLLLAADIGRGKVKIMTVLMASNKKNFPLQSFDSLKWNSICSLRLSNAESPCPINSTSQLETMEKRGSI